MGNGVASVRLNFKKIGKVTQYFIVLCGVLNDKLGIIGGMYVRLINPLNPELNPICYLLALLAHHFLHVRRISVKSLTFRLLMLYIYGAPILDVSRSHTTTHYSR